ncbi:filamentous hemagglutinin N-terminal domain-containing protein [Moorena producens JHB]|uniref:Filamentous hemagglutinin N-terminal domain-containing protein n=1 Tax=Moorena producens (strain JHB) TaxID=1454205 RepID=A0A1D9G070_MOOP1|nr:filamentous hemagglutinin N-terminal domain-containing protein [Moorena producens]AOY81032.1 filamentous hemagglutinin N-terminal domain-containing protein [Moorena producens JHB]
MLFWYSKLPILLISSTAWAVFQTAAYSQIIRDQTLGVEHSIVTPQEFRDLIEGGAIRGSNLFHSFLEFNVNEGQNVYFANPDGIANILTRVTGGSRTRISGTLGVNGAANLYLINPNGIHFGNNARLDVAGSFIATTADGIKLGQQGLFSATEPEKSNLLTIQPGAFFTNALRQHQARQRGLGGPPHERLPQIRNQGNLAVGSGQGLVLSGDLVTSTGSLVAPGGIVEINGSEIGLWDNASIDVSSPNGGGTVLIGTQQTNRSYIAPNVEISANAIAKGNGGRVILQADQITGFYGTISARGGTISGNGGLIEVSGKENLIFRGNVDTSAVNGFPGTLLLDPRDIIIASGAGDQTVDDLDSSSQLTDGATTTIYESTLEELSGNTNIVLEATNDILLEDLADDSLDLASGIGAVVFTADADRDGVGNFVMADTLSDTIRTHGRSIAISGANLTIGNIDTSIPQVADAGQSITNATIVSNAPGVPLESISGTIANVADVDIYQIFLTGGETFSATTVDGTEVATQLFLFDAGGFGIYSNDNDANCGGCLQSTLPAGNPSSPTAPGIYYLAISGFGIEPVSEGGQIFPDPIFPFSLFVDGSTSVDPATPTGGSFPLSNWDNIRGFDLGNYTIALTGVEAPSATFTESASLPETVNSGSITLNATNGGITAGNLNTAAVEGQGGNLTVTAIDNITFEDSSITTAGSFGSGNINFSSCNLFLRNGTILDASTSGTKDGGNVTITATDTVAIESLSLLQSNAKQGASGNGGIITIDTEALSLRDGVLIISETFGQGDGGTLRIQATDVEVRETSVLSVNVNSSATGNGGELTIDTQSLRVKDGAQISSSTNSSGDGGTVTIGATEVEVSGTAIGFSSGLFSQVTPDATGNGGTLTIDTQRLTVRDGAQISSATFGQGNGGTLTVGATDVELIGISADGRATSGLFSSVQPRAIGDGGTLTVDTQKLTISDGAEVRSATFGNGDAGNLKINATESITLSGVSPIGGRRGGQSSRISANTESMATGIGGDITIDTPTIRLDNGAVITARSRSNFPGGEITVDADTLALTDGAQILTSGSSGGDAGSITINATDTITLSGIDPTYNDRLAILGADRVDPDGEASAIASRAIGDGQAGSINLNTKTFILRDQALATVSSTGTGLAGTLEVNANSIQLDNGSLSAETTAGDQGNITLSDAQLVVLRNNSTITTNAREIATGGNITITTDFLVALENSDITANAIFGPGGNITITTIGIFSDRTSDITASSQLGIDGTVNVNTLDVNPFQALAKLPADVVDTSNQIVTSCAALGGNSFVVTAGGGLPADPAAVLRGQVVVPDLRLMVDEGNTQPVKRRKTRSSLRRRLQYHQDRDQTAITNQKLPIIEAQGWIINDQGIVELVAYPTQISHGSWVNHHSCF